MRIKVAFVFIMVSAIGVGSGAGAEPTFTLGYDGVYVQQVTDGDTVVLDDSRRVRLLGINAPELYPVAEAGAVRAKEQLEKLVAHKHVTLHLGKRSHDRHGRLLAHLCRDEDGAWVQGQLLQQGWAWVYTLADNAPGYARAMLAQEQQAREHKRGLWALPEYGQGAFRVTAEHTDAAIGQFRLVTGTVRQATLVRDTLYLNFGDDWRSDFTIRIRAKAIKRFQQEGYKPLTWEGRAVRVRGWLQGINGALIDVTHPQQITLLPMDDAPLQQQAATPCSTE